MIEINGKYTNAIVYADIIDEKTIEQIKTLIDQEFMKDCKVRIMADCHAGEGCVIGTTIEIKDKVVPNLVGVDIGCGMLCVCLGKINLDFNLIDEFIKNNIPAGMNVNDNIIESSILLENLKCFNSLKKVTYLKKSLQSLGGGNHFIEIDKNIEGYYYLIIHTGSRNLGKQVAKIYQDRAIYYHENKLFNKKLEIKRIVERYKELGRENEIQGEIDKIKNVEIELKLPKEFCYLEGSDFDDYLHDMDICQSFASENRMQIAKKITSFIGLDFNLLSKFETIHNYINMKDRILRKGSICAYKNEMVLIPLNMRDGCIIAKGRSNPEYNYSAPHGAGRIMSRGMAFKEISLDSFKKAMDGIYTTTVDQSTIDESPFVYKPVKSILNNIKDTVDIIEIIKPVYNFKAGQ